MNFFWQSLVEFLKKKLIVQIPTTFYYFQQNLLKTTYFILKIFKNRFKNHVFANPRGGVARWAWPTQIAASAPRWIQRETRREIEYLKHHKLRKSIFATCKTREFQRELWVSPRKCCPIFQ